MFSGWLSDRLGRRKMLAVLGYGLGAITKPVFPFAVTPFEVLGRPVRRSHRARASGARRRDALVADVTPKELRGAAFGLRQSLDTVGAFVGPLIAVGLMALLNDDMRAVFGYAVIPAAIAVLLLVLGVEEPPAQPGPARRQGADPLGGGPGPSGAPFWLAVAGWGCCSPWRGSARPSWSCGAPTPAFP